MDNKLPEEEFLMLSGIQHIAFCERQWALIEIEQYWAENVRTVEGKIMHERADDPYADETRKDIRIVRAMPVISHKLGLRGVADIVEFQRSQNENKGKTVQLDGRKGWWRPYPVEYKRGRPKPDDRDAVQLCAQAVALEEMLHISIESGALFYGQTRRREEVQFHAELRKRVYELACKMHELIKEGKTPKAVKGKHCSLCSLVEACQPNLSIRRKSVISYLQKMTNMEVEDD